MGNFCDITKWNTESDQQGWHPACRISGNFCVAEFYRQSKKVFDIERGNTLSNGLLKQFQLLEPCLCNNSTSKVGNTKDVFEKLIVFYCREYLTNFVVYFCRYTWLGKTLQNGNIYSEELIHTRYRVVIGKHVEEYLRLLLLLWRNLGNVRTQY